MIKKITIICGGPSAERGISLNSARSLFDNLDKNRYQATLIYFNPKLEAYKISETQIYSNTPLDFDYKLKNEKNALSKEELASELQSADLVFPAIHGTFGEDGQLQTLLEDLNVKYVGSQPAALNATSNKHLCQQILKKNEFFTIPEWILTKDEPFPELPEGKYVIKPLHGGSSLGVEYFQFPIKDLDDLNNKLKNVHSYEDQALIEPFFEGTEFTLIILQNETGEPVALLPTEIEFNKNSDKFFNYRKKYLASAETRYHTPARFNPDQTEKIKAEAERLFTVLGMRDFARIDGWLKKDGTIWFSDVNGISGMEQNSFLFQQAALFGISHKQLLDYIINKKIEKSSSSNNEKEEIPVIFGGNTAERQVSVMSGTNVWMKLKSSYKYKPIPLFLTPDKKIFQIPQFLCLHHTVEEINEKIKLFGQNDFINKIHKEGIKILNRLNINPNDVEEKIFIPQETTLEEIAEKYNFLFLGLHGGDGENGIIQAKLDKLKLPYNGPGAVASALCMDKFASGEVITAANIHGIKTANKKIITINQNSTETWQQLINDGFTTPLILKPRSDGCSAGVIRIDNEDHFTKVLEYFSNNHTHIPEKAIHNNHGQIDLPSENATEIMVEEFIETDQVSLKDLEIDWKPKNGVIEVTVGVIGEKGNMKAMNPSQTIASQTILSLEEKFMGGTGINLTPPPFKYVNPGAVGEVKKHIENVANILGIEGYSRIDTFMDINTGEVTIIEANTLPGLTPSTVLYHQGLAEPNKMIPRELLEKLIEIGKNRFKEKITDDRKVGIIKKTPQIESFEKKA